MPCRDRHSAFWDDDTAGGELEGLLLLAGSVWTVSPRRDAPVRRVGEAEEQAYEAAVEPGDAASTEFVTAWTKVCGRSPDPSDAWDHAIKAVETVLAPAVAPNQ